MLENNKPLVNQITKDKLRAVTPHCSINKSIHRICG
jgi:hypothetical protein